LILKYGLPPAGGPTGRTQTIEGIEFLEIGPGYFRMGSNFLAEKGDLLGRICGPLGLPWGTPTVPSREMPVRWVEIPQRFWVARHEVTNLQYERCNPMHWRDEWSEGDQHPVTDVSWEDAIRFCAWLSERSGLTARLPSEAEWEFVCRAGSQTEYSFGDSEESLDEYAWFGADEADGAHAVGTKSPNSWGLFDLHGNVSEWCEDVISDYDAAPDDGSPVTASNSPNRVHRGGSWSYPAEGCRSAHRNWCPRRDGAGNLGFRPIIVIPKKRALHAYR
jgi:formylglycine-generating enzyme required for sulfatase activity